jgi:hypothetical protein
VWIRQHCWGGRLNNQRNRPFVDETQSRQSAFGHWGASCKKFAFFDFFWCLLYQPCQSRSTGSEKFCFREERRVLRNLVQFGRVCGKMRWISEFIKKRKSQKCD